MRYLLSILFILLASFAKGQITTSVLSPTGNAKFDTARVFKRDSLIKYVTPSQLSDSLNAMTGFDSVYIYQALTDSAAAIRGDFPTTDSALFVTNYRLDTTRFNLYAAILNSTFDTTYIYQALSDSSNNIRSDLSDSLALKVYLVDSNIVYVTPTELADTAANIRADFPTIAGFVQYSDSLTTFVTPTMLNDTASAIRGDFPLGADSSIFSTNYRLDTTRSAIDLRYLSTSTTSQQNGYFTKTHYYSIPSTYYLEIRNSNTTATAHRSLAFDIGDVDRTLTLTGNTSLTGTNTGDQTSIVGITGTLAEFNTALSGADFATGGGTVTGTSSGTNTGDNAVNTLYSGLVSNATHTGDATGATALTVVALNGTNLAGLGTGLLKNTTGTGIPSIAVNSDLPTMTATVGGAVPTPPNNTTTFLRGDGVFAIPAGGSGDMVLASAQTNSGAKTFLDATLLHRNVANTFSSKFTNTATAARTWTMQDADGTVAFTASPTFTGTVTFPTPWTLGATSVTSTGTQLNYLNAATGTTGTTSTNLVFSTSPVLTTPTLGVASATSLNTGTTLNGIGFFKSTADIGLASTTHAATFGGESNSTNLALGEYSTGVGLQARNNGAVAAAYVNPLGGDVQIGSSTVGVQNVIVNNTDAGTGSYIEMGLRNGATGADGLLFRTLGTGFTTSGANFQDGSAVLTSTNLSGGLSIGTQASADYRIYTNNTLRATYAGAGGVTFATTPTFSTGIPNANLPNGLNNANSAAQSQVVVAGTAYYITKSNLTLPATLKAGMVVGSTYTWRIAMMKTAAGTGAFNIKIYRGTTGTISDVADVTQTIGTQTAVVDNMVFDVQITITATGASGSYFWSIVPVNKAVTATGFGVPTGTSAYRSGTVSAVALNTTSLIFGIGFSCTTGTPTITIPFVQANVNNLD